ncbi:hypothetical protein EAT51_15205 [Pseudoxanthomonas winnipegensis]|uniref:hypothetical protein n=1 Tax=Pseudoxanthomonas winnipegensis TaxID=2480810 RepID=UPI00102DD216|nr:hypothetical protein [Pseudoxanthomonas winnipegensis]TAA39549.1 hypothetical protein EAT51_15205 [Pseudoxanthomonas winnipegensis]
MAYQTGTANTPTALVSSLAGFAGANGWTTTALADGAIGFTAPDGATFALQPTADTIELRGCVGLSSGAAADAQPNVVDTPAVCNYIAGPYTGYTFFGGAEAGAPYLHVVIESEAGVFRSFSLGRLVKFDSTAGGEYATATNWFVADWATNFPENSYHEYLLDGAHDPAGSAVASHVRFDADGASNRWMPIGRNWDGTRATGSMRGGLNLPLGRIGYQRYNKLVPLFPLYVFGDRPSNMRSPIGYAPHLRQVDLRLNAPKEIITIGGEDWQVFPAIQRTDTHDVYGSAVPSSAYYGYAIRKID